MRRNFGFPGISQGSFESRPLPAVFEIGNHLADILDTGCFFNTAAKRNQAEGNLIGQTGVFNGVIDSANSLPRSIDVWFHGNRRIDDKNNSGSQL